MPATIITLTLILGILSASGATVADESSPLSATKLLGPPTEPPEASSKPVFARDLQFRSGVVLFAQFKHEIPAKTDVPTWKSDIFDSSRPGSLSHYYNTMSFGSLSIGGDVAAKIYESEQESSWYISDKRTAPGKFGMFNLEILRQADSDLNFSQFDNDGPDGIPNSADDDGIVDVVFVVTSSAPTGFLSGSATGVNQLGLAEVFVTNDVGFSGEFVRIVTGVTVRGRSFEEAVGSMCHEYGHILGLPDLFNTEFLRSDERLDPEDDSAGIGAWGLMGWGATGWNGNDGPNSLSAWSRETLGWGDVEEVLGARSMVSLEDVSIRGRLLRIPLTAREYFLLEYRTRTSFYDRNIPAIGLLVWHVEKKRGPSGAFVSVDLECADGRWLDAGFPQGSQVGNVLGGDNLDFWAHDVDYATAHVGNRGDPTDPFDGERFVEFGPNSNPSSISNDGIRSILISDIILESRRITMQIESDPLLLEVDRLNLIDESRDDVAVAGESLELFFRLRNIGKLDATEIRALLTTPDSMLEILDAEVELKDLVVDEVSHSPPSLGQFPRLRYREGFVGVRTSDVFLSVHANGNLVAVEKVQTVGVSPQLLIQHLAVIDTAGNDDGIAQAGEFIQLEVEADFENPELSGALEIGVRSLDKRAKQIHSGNSRLVNERAMTVKTQDSPEFLLQSDLQPGTELRFELSVNSQFSVWRDTLIILVGAGTDETPPRVNPPLFTYSGRDLELSLTDRLVHEGGPVRSARVVVFTPDTAVVAEIPLQLNRDQWQGIWDDVSQGTYLIIGEVTDEAGNVGRSQARRIYLFPPTDDIIVPESRSTVLGRGSVSNIVFSPSGRVLAIATTAGILLYDVTTFGENGFQELAFLVGHSAQISDVAFAPDGNTLASSSLDSTVRVWSVREQRELSVLVGHEGAVDAVAFSPDGRTLASAGQDGTVRLWDIESKQVIVVLRRHTGRVYSLAFSPDGIHLASGVKPWVSGH